MARAPDSRIEQAKAMYLKGMKLVEIASQLNLPEGTVRRWKSTHKWDSERSDKKANVRKENKTREIEPVVEAVDSVLENPDLTDKQRLFCLYFVKSFNATKAYQKAFGCDYETAMVEGCKCLRKPKIKTEIHKLKKKRMTREFLSEEDIFQKYMDIAFSDITDYVEFGREQVHVMGAFGPVMVVDEETGKKVPLMKNVNSVRFKESSDVDGTIIAEVKQGKDGASIKLMDREKALRWLTEHMDLATEEQRARIAQIKAQTEKINRESIPEDDDGVVIINDAPKGN